MTPPAAPTPNAPPTPDEIIDNIKDTQSLVKLDLNQKYEWINKNEGHVAIRVFDNKLLTVLSPLPINKTKFTRDDRSGYFRWFPNDLDDGS